MRFGVPMVCHKRREHLTDCYICLTNITGIKEKIRINDVISVVKPALHEERLPVLEIHVKSTNEGSASEVNEHECKVQIKVSMSEC